ncbi:MAG: hypothetical protein R3B90_21885 [Planctomycetaceae bacterium]
MSSLLFAPEPSERHVLKFRPPAAAPDELTLDDAFERCKLPELRNRSRETVSEYRTHLRRWSQWLDDERDRFAAAGEPWKYRMRYPVLAEIGRAELVAFQQWLLERENRDGSPAYSHRTVNKHLGSVQTILRAAQQYEYLITAPGLDALPTNAAARKLWLTFDQVDRLMEAAEVAAWPATLALPAPHYWRAAIVLFCTYGFRTQELIGYESRMRSLQWNDISWNDETPHPEGQASNRFGWLTYTPQKQSNRKPEPLVLPLTATAHRWLQSIAPDVLAGKVFPFPLANEPFYETWRAIVRAAGIAPKLALDGSQAEYQLLHMRKTAVTWINDHRPGMAPYIVGHADDRSPTTAIATAANRSKVQRMHYDCAENRVLETLTTLPMPASFAAVGVDRQLRLF